MTPVTQRHHQIVAFFLSSFVIVFNQGGRRVGFILLFRRLVSRSGEWHGQSQTLHFSPLICVGNVPKLDVLYFSVNWQSERSCRLPYSLRCSHHVFHHQKWLASSFQKQPYKPKLWHHLHHAWLNSLYAFFFFITSRYFSPFHHFGRSLSWFPSFRDSSLNFFVTSNVAFRFWLLMRCLNFVGWSLYICSWSLLWMVLWNCDTFDSGLCYSPTSINISSQMSTIS